MKDLNEVIVIGGNHHNTLSIIRLFGKKKIDFKILIHEDNKSKNEMMISHSKYVKEIYVVNNSENSIKSWLLDNQDIHHKQVIVPCSDLAEYTIDKNYDALAQSYFIPGFKNNPGLVCKLMDKYHQKRWAEKKGIKMAKSWLIKINKKIELPHDLIYPCIVKPNLSVEGSKGDICVCKDNKQLLDELNEKFRNYNEVIVQHFINKKFELLAMGYISNDGTVYGGVERKLRETIPGGGGSTALGQFIDESQILEKTNFVISELYKDGYRGLYDIEFFECDDDIYLNEINFRHSGSGFALIKNGIEAPYLYYLDFLKKEYDKNTIKFRHKTGYFCCDIGELLLLTKYKTINIFQFIMDFFKSYAHSIVDFKDLGVIFFYFKRRRK